MSLRERLLNELFYPGEECAEPTTTDTLAFLVRRDVDDVRRELNFMLVDGLVLWRDGWYQKERP